MSRPSLLTRRQLVVAGGTAAVSAAFVPNAWGRLTAREARVGPGRFLDGVASGEPAPDAVTFWGRLTTEVPRSGARLVVAEDEGLTRTVATAVVPTTASVDHCLKTRVSGLKPSTFYYYAWQSGDDTSPVGRTKTAPAADSNQPLNIQFSSCQNWPVGFFNGLAESAQTPLDLCVFLGDYTYEYGPGEYGDTASSPRQDPSASVDLASYRAKLKLYRSDAGLRELHRLHPMVHIWDDHEVEDNYNEADSLPSQLQQTTGYRASFEWLPRMTFPEDRFRIYKTVRLGTMADLILLDQRQYRNAGGQNTGLLGRRQLDFLKAELASSKARWKLIGNEVMVAPLASPSDGAPLNADQWDGYPAERLELLEQIKQVNAADPFGGNVVFLTGDIHTFMANEVLGDDGGRRGTQVASEFIGGSVTSPGLPGENDAVEAAVRAANPWIRQFNGRVKGYGKLDLTDQQATVTYRVSDVLQEGAPSQTLSSFVQPVGANAFERTDGGGAPGGGGLPSLPTLPREAALGAARSNPALDLRRRRWERAAARASSRRERAAARRGRRAAR